jgi:hypothetical protein
MSKLIPLPDDIKKEIFKISGKVEIFPQQGGWYYIRVPKKYTNLTKDFTDRGLVAISVTLGKTVWNTSLLPYGDETHFIALSAKVRKAEKVELEDKINLSFQLRDR